MTSRERLVVAVAIALVLGGVLGISLGVGMYYRSDRYRHNIECELTEFFALPIEVGRVEAHTFRSRVFRDITIWLPDRRDRICSIPAAVWSEGANGSRTDLFLDLTSGTITIGSQQWLHEDYWKVLRATFTKNLTDVNLRQVRLNGMNLIWQNPRVRLSAENVTGRILFDKERRGEATLIAESLNGGKVAEPIHIFARVDPAADDFLPEMRLTVPTLPLSSLRLDGLIGSDAKNGRFQGTIAYFQRGQSQDVLISGQVDDLELRELTGRIPFGPLDGRVSLRIDDANLQILPERSLRSMRFAGQILGLEIAPLARRAGLNNLTGIARLSVHNGVIENGRVQEMLAGGQIARVPMEPLTRQLGEGIVRGDLNVDLYSLRVVSDEIVSLDAVAEVSPPKAGGTIDRKLLLGVVRDSIGLTIPENLQSLLPERIEYTRMGARLFVKDGRLHVLGSSSGKDPAMVTLRMLGQDLPIPPPSGSLDMNAILAKFKAGTREVDYQKFKKWWLTTAPATQP